jgi:hypothetical protein
MIVWFGNIYGWLWILLSSGYDYTRGCDKKIQQFLCIILLFILCVFITIMWGGVFYIAL